MKVTSHLSFCTVGAIWDCGEPLVHSIHLLILWDSSWFLLILFYSSRWRRRNFLFTPHQTFLSGVNWSFFARQMHSTSKFDKTSLSKCVCVKRLNRRKTSLPAHFYIFIYSIIFYYSRGSPGPRGGRWSTKTPPPGPVNVPAGLWWCTWAHLSRSWWPP